MNLLIGTAEASERAATCAAKFGITRFDVTNANSAAGMALRPLATQYLIAYNGDFGFLQSCKPYCSHLSVRQLAGVLNCMLAEAKRTAAPKPAPVAPVVPRQSTAVSNGTYTVVLGNDNDYVTLKLETPTWGDFKPGTQVAEYLSGSDNERDFTGFAFVRGGAFQPWKKFSGNTRITRALQVLLGMADPTEAGRAYAMRSGNCYKCGRKLTTPESVAAGIGPVCAGRD